MDTRAKGCLLDTLLDILVHMYCIYMYIYMKAYNMTYAPARVFTNMLLADKFNGHQF